MVMGRTVLRSWTASQFRSRMGTTSMARITSEDTNSVFVRKLQQRRDRWKLTGEGRPWTSPRQVDRLLSMSIQILQAKKDYAQHDSGPGVNEVVTVVTQPYLQDLKMLKFYTT